MTCAPSAGTIRTLHYYFIYFCIYFAIFNLFQVTSHPEPVSQSMSLQQPPQSQYNLPDRDKQLLFSEFEDLSASFRSLYKSVFEQTFNQQGETFIYQNYFMVTVVLVVVVVL